MLPLGRNRLKLKWDGILEMNPLFGVVAEPFSIPSMVSATVSLVFLNVSAAGRFGLAQINQCAPNLSDLSFKRLPRIEITSPRPASPPSSPTTSATSAIKPWSMHCPMSEGLGVSYEPSCLTLGIRDRWSRLSRQRFGAMLCRSNHTGCTEFS